jgi:hypothetical protein
MNITPALKRGPLPSQSTAEKAKSLNLGFLLARIDGQPRLQGLLAVPVLALNTTFNIGPRDPELNDHLTTLTQINRSGYIRSIKNLA